MTGPRILLLGVTGQVGQALHPHLAALGDVAAHGRTTCDLGDPAQLRDVIRNSRPNLIVNAAAYTAVDRAETDADLCRRVNAEAPQVLAEEARRAGAWLIHYSTDYVFDGKKASAYLEDDTPAPLNVYGRTKLAGDLAIAACAQDYTILRVSWVYSPSGRNFANTILNLASTRHELKIVADQFGAPTPADLIATTTSALVERHIMRGDSGSTELARGVFNLAPSGRTSWHQYAVELVREAKRQGRALTLPEDKIIPITTAEYPTPAERPKNSSLDTAKIRHLLGADLPPWQVFLHDFVARAPRA